MKKGFTMIELIFVIVILGILAAVAIPKLAATRDDAKLAAVKTDIGTYMGAIPAWYQGQQDARIAEAVSLDTKQWVKGTNQDYTLSINSNPCVTIAVWEINGTTADNNNAPTISATTGAFTATIPDGIPVFRVIKGNAAGTYVSETVCNVLWTDLGVNEQNISMAGSSVKW